MSRIERSDKAFSLMDRNRDNSISVDEFIKVDGLCLVAQPDVLLIFGFLCRSSKSREQQCATMWSTIIIMVDHIAMWSTIVDYH